MKRYQTYDRAEIANTESGAPSYEMGGAFGGPIVEDRIGFRVSVYYRYNGGFIDAVNGMYAVLDPTGAAYGKSVAFTPTSTFEKNINWDQGDRRACCVEIRRERLFDHHALGLLPEATRER